MRDNYEGRVLAALEPDPNLEREAGVCPGDDGDDAAVGSAAPWPTATGETDDSGHEADSRRVALRLWIALARCYGTVYRALAQKVAEYDLTTAQFAVLEALYHLGPLTLGDLADKLLVTGGNVTYVMDRLQKDGLVTRRRCSQDRRVIWADLTDEGRVLIEEVFPSHARDIESMVQVLDVSEQEALRVLLKKLGKGIAEADAV